VFLCSLFRCSSRRVKIVLERWIGMWRFALLYVNGDFHWLLFSYFVMLRFPELLLDWSWIRLLIVGSEPWLGFMFGYPPSLLDLLLLVCTNIRQFLLGDYWWFSRDWIFKDQSIRPVTVGLGSFSVWIISPSQTQRPSLYFERSISDFGLLWLSRNWNTRIGPVIVGFGSCRPMDNQPPNSTSFSLVWLCSSLFWFGYLLLSRNWNYIHLGWKPGRSILVQHAKPFPYWTLFFNFKLN
jgi:hypothetical protein